MNITYEILWIEDQKESVQDSVEDVESYIDDLGFEPQILVASPFDRIEDQLGDSRWHLVAMDYDLGDTTGTELIQQIREKGLQTEVVFYSSDPEKVEDAVMKAALEGVYWATREDSDLEDKIKAIIDLTLRRVMDVNTMRGIVIAEVAEIDYEMEDIIRFHHDQLDDAGKVSFRRKIVEKVKGSYKSNLNRATRYLTACTIEDCLAPTFLDTSKRQRAVSNVINVTPAVISQDQKDLLDRCPDTITKRNTLAHGRTVKVNGEEIVTSPLGNFKLEDAIQIRKDLRAHRKNFKDLKDALNDHHEGRT